MITAIIKSSDCIKVYHLISPMGVALYYLDIAVLKLDRFTRFNHRLEDLLSSLVPITGFLGLLKLLLQLLDLALVVVLDLHLELFWISRCCDFSLSSTSLRARLQAMKGIATIL